MPVLRRVQQQTSACDLARRMLPTASHVFEWRACRFPERDEIFFLGPGRSSSCAGGDQTGPDAKVIHPIHRDGVPEGPIPRGDPAHLRMVLGRWCRGPRDGWALLLGTPLSECRHLPTLRDAFAQAFPDTLNILLLDNSGAHTAQRLRWPDQCTGRMVAALLSRVEPHWTVLAWPEGWLGLAAVCWSRGV